jgi:putative ABC transport system substrate-binding protein
MSPRTRRQFLVSAVLLLAAMRAGAQPAKRLPKIGFASSTGDSAGAIDEIKRSLRDIGYVEGRDYAVEIGYAEGKLDRIPSIVDKLVQQNVDVLVLTTNVAIIEAKQATRSIPIVMLTTVDPVAAGYVASLARPGANITGITLLSRDLSAKRVELLREMIPGLARVAVLWDPEGPGPVIAFREYEAAAKKLGIRVQSLRLRGTASDVEGALRSAREERANALIVVTNPLVNHLRPRIIERANAARIPTVFESAEFVSAGGLLSYGASTADMYTGVATYVDRILKGARPGDLPIQQPAKFDVVINLKTARMIGLQVPQSLLLRAARVIE